MHISLKEQFIPLELVMYFRCDKPMMFPTLIEVCSAYIFMVVLYKRLRFMNNGPMYSAVEKQSIFQFCIWKQD